MLSLLTWSAGCHQATTPSPDSTAQLDTTLFTAPQPCGTISDLALAEVSGMAPSLRNPGYLWVEEDSGNPNQIQLISPEGNVMGRFTLPTLSNQDWEDIATSPGPKAGQSYIYLAEIGDNAAGRANRIIHRLFNWPASKVIYRLAEPALTSRTLPTTDTILAVATIRLTLPDGPRDAEAILVDPATNDIYVLSKEWDCEIYRAAYPQSLTAPVAMERVLTLPLRKVTSAAISPDGTEILVRTYKQLFYYKRRTGESIPAALRRTPRLIPMALEPQGEAISWRLDGSGYYSASEKSDDDPQIIYGYQRKRGASPGWAN